MQKPDLELLAQWLDPALMIMLDGKRRLKNEWRRRRKLATLEMLWLMLAVSLDTHRSSLYKILRLATGHLDIKWSISVAAFCKARARFSPGGFILVAWGTGLAAAISLQGPTPSLAWVAPARQRQDHSILTRISFPLQLFRCTQRPTGIGADCRRTLLPL